MRRRHWFGLVTVMALAACGGTGSDESEQGADAVSASKHRDLERLEGTQAILDAVFAEGVRHWPTVAIYVDDRTRDAELEDFGPEESERFLERCRILRKKMKTIDPASLSGAQIAAHDVAQTFLEDVDAGAEAKADLWYLNVWDWIENFSYVTGTQKLRSAEDVDHLVSRYQKVKGALGAREANLARGAKEGLVASRPIVDRVAKRLRDGFIASAADGSPYAQVVFAEGVSDADKTAWKARVDAVVDATVVPAVKHYVEFLERELAPQARSSFGFGGLGAVGTKYYQTQISVLTGTKMTAKEVYDLGTRRVGELEVQMKTELDALGVPQGTLTQRLAAVKARPDAQNATAEDTKARGSVLSSKLASQAGSLWGLPGLAPAALDVQPGSESGYYVYGSNTLTLFTGPYYLNVPTIMHEFTHYMQEVATRDTEAVSPLVKFFGGTAMTEGGAHYAETLAMQNGTYASDGNLVKLGALSDLMLRAVRLVVDPGIHAMGWERTRAIGYMRDHVLMDEEGIAFEIDRYASYGAQALGYRIGMEAIANERARAERELGPNFSEAKFNRMVLELSGVSPRVLERKVTAMIGAGRR